jgi:Concanavalin A-like lectin/glucanases superfamily
MVEEMLRGGNRGIVGFDPTTIPGCTVWFDSADLGTMSTSVSSVQTWRSKGSASCTATYKYNAPSISTIGGLSTLYFNGVSTMMTTNTIASYGATETTWITCAASLATVSSSTPADACPVIATQGAGAERSIRYTCNVNATAYSINTSVLRQTTGDNTNGVRGFIDTAAYFAGFTNGALIASNTTAVTFQAGYNQSFVMGQWNVGWLNGYIYEILIYNRALSIGEYQSVEGYLSQKWGFSPAKVFTPTSIPGCQLWLDGADPAGTGSAPASGATVATWVDKSGNGYNGTAVGSPTYSSKGILLTRSSSQYFTLPNSTYPSGANPYSIFMAFNLNSYSVAGFVGAGDYSTTWGTIAVRGNASQSIQLYWWGDSGNLLTTNTFTLNTPNILCTTGTSTARAIYLNAQTPTTDTQTGPRNQLTTGNTIGRAYPADGTLDGYISEVLVYNSVLTTTQRQAVEGYLAWKWGLQGSLPSTHPYYITTANFVKSGTLVSTHPFYRQMPMTRPFTPLDLPGCALWLDGADQSSVTFSSGSNVSQWNDKSGNGLNATVLNGTPTYTQALGMTFNGSSALQVTYTASPTIETLFVIIKFNSVSAQGDIFSGTAMGQREYLMYSPYSPGTIYLGRYGTAPSGSINGGTVTTSSNYMLGYVFNGTANTISLYQGGNLTSSGTPQFTYSSGGTISAIGSYNGNGYLQGQIYELIVYSTALTTAQRQAVEGYLANKWGLKPSLPAFVNPTSIPGCALWFDGNDPAGTGVAPANGATLSTWVNKGTTSVTMAYGTSQPTFSSNFQNGLGSVSFNGNYFSGSYSFNLGVKSGFLVCSQSNSATDSPQGFLSFYGSGGDTVASTNGFGYQATQGGYGSFGWLYNIFQSGVGAASPSTGYYIQTGTAGANTPLAIYGNVMSNQYEQAFVNGTNNSNFTITTTPGTSTTLMLGARWVGGGLHGSLYGNICEVIVYNVGLTASQRQTVEGYLAWKWGLQAQLPATHPFYATVPVPHPFNKVPPTIRQPALYSDVTPGNWARDWQPYLQTLVKANAGATQNIGSITGGGTYTSYGWFGNVLAPNGNIYFVPYCASNILVLNTNTGVTTNITGGATFTTFNQYRGGVLAPNGNIYCVPLASTNILVINPNTGVTSNMTGSATFTSFGWHGGVLGPDGNIYCAPYSASNILVIKPATGTTSNLTGGATYSGGGAWAGGVLAPNGNIYFAPNAATNILVLNTMTGVTSNLTGGATYSGSWTGGVLATNGNIYFCPYTASNVLVLNPATGVTSNLVGGASYPGGGAWAGGVLAPNGKIYFPPSGGATNILVVDPIAGTTSTLTSGVIGSSAWQGGVLAPNGTIYFTPLIATTILTVSFTGLLQTPSLNYCMSAYTNKL